MNIIELLNKSAAGLAAPAPNAQTKTASAAPARLSNVELLQVMVTHNHMEKAAALNLPPASWQRVAGTAAGAGIGAGTGYLGAGAFTDDRRIKLLSAILGGLGGGIGGYYIGSKASPLAMTDEMKKNLVPPPATPAQEGLATRREPGAWNAMNHDSSSEGTKPEDAEKADAEIDKQTAKKPDEKKDKDDPVKKAAALYTEKGA